jgi:hypothetical protein
MELTKEQLKIQAQIAHQHAKDLDTQIKNLEREERDRKLEELKPLAAKAHNLLCQYNHTDGCGWGYEEDCKNKSPWTCETHSRWLDKIDKIVNGEPSDSYSRGYKPVSKELLECILDKVADIKAMDPEAWYILQYRLK